jgi:hypothetical protein
LDDWFDDDCAFRLRFEKAAQTFRQQQSGGKVVPRNWKTFANINLNLEALYGPCNGKEDWEPKQIPEFRDLIYLWEYCSRNINDDRVFLWFKHLSTKYARNNEWEAPRFKPLAGNS